MRCLTLTGISLLWVSVAWVTGAPTDTQSKPNGKEGIAEPQQDRVISGRVTTKQAGTPMPGVNVVIKGTQMGTTTDAAGRYTLTVNGSNRVLVFS